MVNYYSSYYQHMSYPRVIATMDSFRMVNKGEILEGTMGEKVDSLIIDSGILTEKTDADITKLIKIQKEHADIAVPPDEFEDVEATVENTVDWLDRSGFSEDEAIFPLQGKTPDDYLRCLDLLEAEGIEPKYVGLGGLIVKTAAQIRPVINITPALRKRGLDVHLFGLGINWINDIRRLNPTSWDSSHSVRLAIEGTMLNADLSKRPDCRGIGAWERLAITYWNNHQIEKYLEAPWTATRLEDFDRGQ
jgi:hypothetical protein